MINTQAEFFNSYADRWDSMEREDIHILIDRVVREAEICPDMDILDVGTGTGVLIPSLLKAMNNSGKIIAIDISEGMLRVAKSKRFPDIVDFRLADIEEFSCWDSFDRVMCNAVFPHFTDKGAALSRIYQMIRPGGYVVISHPIGREAVNRIHSEAGSTVTEDRVPDTDKMRQLLKSAGFTDIEIKDEPEFYIAIGKHR